MPPCRDRKSTRLNSSHANISYAVFCLKKKKIDILYVFFQHHMKKILSFYFFITLFCKMCPILIFLVFLTSICSNISTSRFFFNDTATTEIYTLSLHDALPISGHDGRGGRGTDLRARGVLHHGLRSEEHTSELQSRQYLVCRLLLEKRTEI